jgi:signal transduction histidine kinase
MAQDRGMLGILGPRTAAWLAFGLFGLTVVAGVSGAALRISNSPVLGNDPSQPIVILLIPVFAIVGALIASRRPEHALGWIFCGMSLLFCLEFFGEQYADRGILTAPGSLPAVLPVAWVQSWMLWVFWPAGIALFLILFPSGRPPSSRWWPVVWLAVVFAATMALSSALHPGPLSDPMRSKGYVSYNFGFLNPTGISGSERFLSIPDTLARMGSYFLIVIAATGLVIRLRRSTGEERQQLKWIAYVGSAILLDVITFIALDTSGQHRLADVAFTVLILLILVGIPAAAGIAILKYRLYDIDIVINKTLLFGAMAAFITVVYVAIVVGLGNLVGMGGKPNLGLSILATALVAIAFEPVRERVQRIANRLVYGKRATPYEVLSQFSHHVAGVYSSEEVLPRMARVLAEGTGAVRADVWIRLGDEIATAASWPPGKGPAPAPVDITGQMLPAVPGLSRIVPVRHQGELLGALSTNKRPGEALTPIEEKLLADLASQAGIVLQSVRLSAELQARLTEISQQAGDLRASRQRIVAAQDAERRRLERNIHDGAQQNLVALTVKLRLATNLAKRDPERARVSVKELEAESDQALETLRALASGIYPPLLREHGLAAAVRAEAEKMPVRATVRADHLDRYAPDVEAAVYFVCLEALQNVTKHARASRVEIDIHSVSGELLFEVIDDGAGFDVAKDARGSGLRNMIDRIEGIGGRLQIRSAARQGTTVTGTVPVGALEAVS